jgi:ferritin-like metal-binding protein YciE
MMEWADEYLTMLDDCEKRESQLSDWERSFVDSLRAWIENGKRPTAKQIETLDNVWDKATKKG